jgi:subtilisin family serine protease
MKKMKLLLILLSLGMGASPTLFAQQLTHVQGEILVQLQNNATPQELVQRYNRGKDASLHLKVGKEIARHSNIHSFTFDHQYVNEDKVLSEIRRDRFVEIAQFNHFITLRSTIPDDPLFPDQWQYINDGSDGGVAGADIDMDLAWDFTTGGLSAYGDTIVACVIDDGIDHDHPDIQSNLWVNHAEIPNNGIDDDNNGFVDDYRGWDTGSDSDEVYDGGGHGTPVAGIIGAKGNNGIGVAGVNWDVKLMIVQGGTGIESEVLEAYSYPLEARIRYNETNGQEGAFVVVTNASWGVDFGQPEDSPLWCAFYDTLGVHGIISCGATANIGIDIDVEGDLPTGCSSDYLISVTNMRRNDVKVNSAGYGLETIDLGAFGAQTYTTAAGANYGGFGGTSGATPHVAGTVALMYGLPCTNLMDLSVSDPGAAALLIKEAILNGTDPNESLEGITVTGGRLNVFNTASLLTASCGGCTPPLNVSVVTEADSIGIISFTQLDSSAQANIRIRPVGTDDWLQLDSIQSPYTFSNLSACTTYEFQLQSECSDTSATDFTNSLFFTTDGCCINPVPNELIPLDETTTTLSWPFVYAATGYQILFREEGTTAGWDTIVTTELNYSFDQLSPCTSYEYAIRTLCADATINFTTPQSFTTFGCGACLDLEYCDTDELNTGEEYISLVTIGDFSNESSASPNGYQSFAETAPPVELTTYHNYPISLTPTFVGQTYSEAWRVWIDYNHDGDFEDAGELVFEAGPSSSTVTGEFTIPETALEGLTRMRVYMRFSTFAESPCNNNFGEFGEVEDYCVNITAGQPCPVVTSAMQDTINLVSDTSALLTWTVEDMPASFTYRYRATGDLEWTEVTNHSGISVVIEGLAPCTQYDFEIKSYCSSTLQTAYSPTMVFSTACATTSTQELESLARWSISPNPARDQIVLDYVFDTPPQWVQLEVINQIGQAVSVQSLKGRNAAIDISNFASGVYFLRLRTPDGYSKTKRLVKW